MYSQILSCSKIMKFTLILLALFAVIASARRSRRRGGNNGGSNNDGVLTGDIFDPIVTGIQTNTGTIITTSSFAMVAEVTDNVGVARVSFRVEQPFGNDRLVFEAVQTPGTNMWNASIQFSQDGVHEITVRAEDASNNRVSSQEISVTVAREDVPVPATADELLGNVSIMIRNIISNNRNIAPTFVRMGFHDCVGAGGCNGCINIEGNIENLGLEVRDQHHRLPFPLHP
jgi:hypothetical protein